MDSEPETTRWERLGEFPLLDLIAERGFTSASSVTFHLGTKFVNWIGGTEFRVIGHVDLHHPCGGEVKARIRVCLPERYRSAEQMDALARELLERVGITNDETFELLLVVPAPPKMLLLHDKDRGRWIE